MDGWMGWMGRMGWTGWVEWMGWILHLQEVGTIVCTTNHTEQIPPPQISHREPQHALHPPFHIPQTYYSLFIGQGHFSSILYHIILPRLSFAHVLPSCPLSCTIEYHLSSPRVVQIAYEHPLSWILDFRPACRHAPHSGGP